MKFLVFALVVLLAVAAVNAQSRCTAVGGTCKDYRQCSGSVRSGLCPGGYSNKCCVPPSSSSGSQGGDRCSAEGGRCMHYAQCSGTPVRGLCPGSYSNQCCKPSSTSSNPPSGGSLTSTIPNPRPPQRVSYARQSTMLRVMNGVGCGASENCQSIRSSYSKSHLFQTRTVGPIRVTGIRPALDALERVFAAVRRENPTLYNAIGTAGMACCRLVRGSRTNFSNHSWGTAIDLKINGVLDGFGDNRTQRGLYMLYPYFAREGFYWGAGFSREDSMHFEVSEEKIQEWSRQGLLN